MIGDCDYGVCGDCNAFDLVNVGMVIAPKASSEGLVFQQKWVTVIMVCVVTVMV